MNVCGPAGGVLQVTQRAGPSSKTAFLVLFYAFFVDKIILNIYTATETKFKT